MSREDQAGPQEQDPGAGCGDEYCSGARLVGYGRGRRQNLGAKGGGRRLYRSGPPCCVDPAEAEEPLPPAEEIELLRSEAERLRSVLESIEARLDELENA
jgi:hypothetical protein